MTTRDANGLDERQQALIGAVAPKLLEEVVALRAEIGGLKAVLGMRGMPIEAAIEKVYAEDLSFLDREGLEGHYRCALVNWDIVLDERNEAQAENAVLCRAVRAYLDALRVYNGWPTDRAKAPLDVARKALEQLVAEGELPE